MGTRCLWFTVACCLFWICEAVEVSPDDVCSATGSKTPSWGVYSDFDSLRAVVVGRADHFRLPEEDSEPLLDEEFAASITNQSEEVTAIYRKSGNNDQSAAWGDWRSENLGVEYPAFMVKLMNDGLDNLSKLLQSRNISVFRSSRKGLAGQTSETGNKGYSSRDHLIVIGDTLFITPTPYVSRSLEVDEVYGHLISQVRRNHGIHIVDLRTSEYWQRYEERGSRAFLVGEHEQKSDLLITEELPLFDAANVFMLNAEVAVYLVSISGNRAGADLLKSHLNRQGINLLLIEGVYYGAHVDTTILPLSKEKLLFNADWVTLDKMREYFGPYGYTNENAFIGITRDDIVPTRAHFLPVASQYIAMNVLQLSSSTVIVEAAQTKIANKLRSHGFEVLSVSLPYTRDFAGGLHCVTAPLFRARDSDLC
eukprot:TRINITY_DN25838_c0_g1_i2.p1 TRINITY_DN25838_c0_g1~~TRINITY_DN25838_c0_g1_i2.p1  ORF type:complete len:457 (-),score=2.62 TRINITY_DN25838_c0_g1_i2:7-1275(-)